MNSTQERSYSMSLGSASIDESTIQNAVQPEQPQQPNEPENDSDAEAEVEVEAQAEAEVEDDIAISDSVESEEDSEPVDDNEDNESIDHNDDNGAEADLQSIEEEEEKQDEEEKEEVDLTDEQIDERMTSAWDAPTVTRTHRARTEKSMNPQWDNPASKDILGRLSLHGKRVVFN